MNIIEQEKNRLRIKLKEHRKLIPNAYKSTCDNEIFNLVSESEWYKNSDIILTYVSTSLEIDTLQLIDLALNDNKNVAVPKCVSGTTKMDFFYIKSLDDLESGQFSIMEPKSYICEKAIVEKCNNIICIVPGLAFDNYGYRLGYGKGYYDRFFAENEDIFKIGLCYSECIVEKLYIDNYDIPVNSLVTEKYIKTF